MKTTVRHRSMAALVAIAIKRVMRSQRVAEKCMVGSVAFVVLAASSGNLLLLAASLMIGMAAVRHLKKIESINGNN
jgi:hypothetical protein